MNPELSDEQAAAKRLATEFVDREIAPHATDWDRYQTPEEDVR